MTRVVVDTNVIVSALVFGGVPREVMNIVEERLCKLYYSSDIREEVERVLEEKFGWDREQVEARVNPLFNWGIQVHPGAKLSVIKDDPDDDRILECAIEADAHVIISGDRHLLKLGSFRTIAIQTPRQFFAAKPWLNETN